MISALLRPLRLGTLACKGKEKGRRFDVAAHKYRAAQ